MTTESSPNRNKTESFKEHFNENICDTVKCKDLLLGLILNSFEDAYVAYVLP